MSDLEIGTIAFGSNDEISKSIMAGMRLNRTPKINLVLGIVNGIGLSKIEMLLVMKTIEDYFGCDYSTALQRINEYDEEKLEVICNILFEKLADTFCQMPIEVKRNKYHSALFGI